MSDARLSGGAGKNPATCVAGSCAQGSAGSHACEPATPVAGFIDELLADHQACHSDFQMDYWITLRSGGTPYGCYRQALRELAKRQRGLVELEAQRDLLEIDIDELALSVDPTTGVVGSPTTASAGSREPTTPVVGSFATRRAAVELRRKRRQLAECRRTLAETRRELEHFAAQARTLREHLDITRDKPLTPQRRAELDRDMWAWKLQAMAAVDYATTGRLGRNTIELLGACPGAMRRDLARQILGEPARVLGWYLERDPPTGVGGSLDPALPVGEPVPALPVVGEPPTPVGGSTQRAVQLCAACLDRQAMPHD